MVITVEIYKQIRKMRLNGMSDRFGLMSMATVQNEYLEGQAYMDCSQATAAGVDQEVQALLDRAYADAVALLTQNRALLDEISLYLLNKETITGDELMAYVSAAQKPAPPESPADSTEG